MIKNPSICFFLLLCLASCGIFKSTSPPPKYEFRGVWIATVVNIDWPKHPSDAWEKQKADYLRLLNFYQNLNFNAVIVQVRTAGDAFYPSAYAPWSRFLTGAEGVAPETDEDPLQWMINEAHSRGFEFHAWLNPYRATFDLNLDVLSETHDYNKHPEWMLKYGKKYYYDPGLPEVQQHLVRIMQEVVTNYDVDALHFDDYFYPYKIRGEILGDSLSYASFALPGQSLQDWRRSNVDSLVKNVQQGIKKVKPWVRFGVSPFGVWKNNSTDPRGSDTRAGQTTYEDLYADPLLWMEQGWIDYLVPQVYWSMNLPVASHEKIVTWWANDSIASNLYIGNAAYKIRNNSDKAWKKKKELPNQLKLARSTPKVQGNVLFSAKSLLTDHKDVVKYIKKKYYNYPALPPPSPLFEKKDLLPPELPTIQEAENYIQFRFNNREEYRYVIVYATRKTHKLTVSDPRCIIDKIHVGGKNSFNLGKSLLRHKKNIALTFMDPYGFESKPIIIHLDGL